MELKDMLTPKQAAEITGYDDAHIRREILNGNLPAYKPSPRVILIHRDDLDTWMKSDSRSGKGRRGRPHRQSKQTAE